MKVAPPDLITGKKIAIKRLQPSDISRFYKLITRNKEYILESFPRLHESCKNWHDTDKYIAKSHLEWNQGKQFRYLLIKEDVPEALGYISIKNLDWDIPKCEMGYFVDLHAEGQGIATEALQLATGVSFEKLKLEKIFLRILKGNLASKRVAEKNGFRLEGVLQREFKNKEGQLKDIWYFGKVRDMDR